PPVAAQSPPAPTAWPATAPVVAPPRHPAGTPCWHPWATTAVPPRPTPSSQAVPPSTQQTIPCGGQAELDTETVVQLIAWWRGLETPPPGGVLRMREQDLPEAASSEFSGECGPAPTGGGGVIRSSTRRAG